VLPAFRALCCADILDSPGGTAVGPAPALSRGKVNVVDNIFFSQHSRKPYVGCSLSFLSNIVSII